MNSPGKFLMSDLINPSARSINFFRLHLDVGRSNLETFIKGGKVGYSFLFQLAKRTNTCAITWIQFQTTWLFAKYCATRKFGTIKSWPHHPSVSKPGSSLGSVLESNFLRPLNIMDNELAEVLGINVETIRGVLRDQNRISADMAVKLGDILYTSSKYWLDIQLYFELEKLLKHFKPSIVYSSKSFREFYQSLLDPNRNSNIYCSIVPTEHPGVILNKTYFQRTTIASADWPRILCLNRQKFESIINGRCEIPPIVILKLGEIFDLSPEYWFEMQNCFQARQGEREVQNRPTISLIGFQRETIPGNFLRDILKTLHITLPQFSNHIKINPKRIWAVINGTSEFDFELAIRTGQAFDMEPHQLVAMQMLQELNDYLTSINNHSNENSILLSA